MYNDSAPYRSPHPHRVLDPLYLPNLDIDELEAACLRRGIKVYREYIDDGYSPPRWGLRLEDV